LGLFGSVDRLMMCRRPATEATQKPGDVKAKFCFRPDLDVPFSQALQDNSSSHYTYPEQLDQDTRHYEA
jgi:hypothetical protein